MTNKEKICAHQCQSCGMPLAKDPSGQGGGTEKDWSISTKYCSYCYKDWEFVGGDCTLDEMKKIVDEAMKKQGMWWFIRKVALWQLPRLERWRK